MLLPAMLTGAITYLTTAWDADDDDDANSKLWARIIRDVVANPFSGMPVGGNAINVAVSSIINSISNGSDLYQGDLLDPGYVTTVSELFSKFTKGTSALTEGDWARATWLWADVLSAAYKMPVLQIYKRAVNIQKALGLGPFEFQEEIEEAIKPSNKKGN
jgi:hypothetical protein